MRMSFNRKEIQAMANLVDMNNMYTNIIRTGCGESPIVSNDGRSELQKAEDWINSKLSKTLGESTKIAKVSVTLTGRVAIDINPTFIKEGLELYGSLLLNMAEPITKIAKTFIDVVIPTVKNELVPVMKTFEKKGEDFGIKWEGKHIPEDGEVMDNEPKTLQCDTCCWVSILSACYDGDGTGKCRRFESAGRAGGAMVKCKHCFNKVSKQYCAHTECDINDLNRLHHCPSFIAGE